MDFSKLSKDDLVKIAKVNNLSNYSKLKKDDFVDLIKKTKSLSIPDHVQEKLDKASEKSASKKEKKPKDDSSPPKPKSEKLDKKLAKFVDLEPYKDKLAKYIDSEEPSDEELLEIVSDKTATFTETITKEDHKKYVDTYGTLKLLLEYAAKNKTSFTKVTEEQLYEKLALFLYDKDENLYKALLEKIKKYIQKLKKADEKQKKAGSSSKTTKKSKKSKKDEEENDEEEEEDMSDDNEQQEENSDEEEL